jgi:glycosyltransferase involved in cell wall biosynthesis
MLDDGQEGRIVPIRDPAALGGALADVLGSPDRGRAMGALGRARVLSRFPLERCIGETERFLGGLARG